MKVGVVVPQGWTGEYEGVAAAEAWRRTLAAARRVDELGFESMWLFDHVHTVPQPREIPSFESYAALTALGALTSRARLGHLVTCAGFRNPALVAKMAATMDVITGGRLDLGIGAGWKREEWLAYGWGFPSLRARQQHLRDSLEIITRMLHRPGRATYEGETASVEGAINEPRPLQEHLPIMVGGNGRRVTWRIAAEFADELNLDNMPAAEWADARRDLEARCREVGRDPGTVRVSVHIWWETLDAAASRSRLLREYADAGIDRVMTLVRAAARDAGEIDRFAEDCREAGVEMATVGR
jgi:alkanesulfonate monooxygenase SsuD/methylene tetrahydromethanopterin reductase-like flavin-dependent oxidoreductase (luciferase family)